MSSEFKNKKIRFYKEIPSPFPLDANTMLTQSVVLEQRAVGHTYVIYVADGYRGGSLRQSGRFDDPTPLLSDKRLEHLCNEYIKSGYVNQNDTHGFPQRGDEEMGF